MRRHALLIIACPRSGATALAGALALCGAHSGRKFVATPAGEPEATCQSAPLVALNDRLLAAIGLRWDSLVAPPERWRERPGVRALAAEADAVIASEFGDTTHALLYDPRLAVTAPFWRERLEAADYDVSAVLVVRRPAEVAASLAKREPFAPEKSLVLWLHYLSEGERGSRGLPRVLITYDRLLDAPAGVLSHVASEARFGLKIEREGREAALSAIRPDLKHFGGERAIPAGALSSGVDIALDEGYRRLAQLQPGTDPRRTIEALVQEAHASLNLAIPPWLARELAFGRAQAERQADALAASQVQIAALEDALVQGKHAEKRRDGDEVALRNRIDALSRTDNSEGRGARVDEALAQLRSDVGRIAHTLSDQPAREQAMRLELSQAQRDLEDERATIARLSESLERERAEGEAQAAKLALAQQHFEALVAEVEQARAAEASWTGHNAELAQNLDQTQSALHAMQSERDALRKERDEAMRQLDRLKVEAESLRTDLKIIDNDRTALAARARAVDEAASGLREELARRGTAEGTVLGERDRLAAEVRNQADRVATLERELGRRMGELTSLAGRHDTMARTLAALERSWIGRKALAARGVRRRGSGSDS